MEDNELATKLSVVLKDIEEIMNQKKVRYDKLKEATQRLENEDEDLVSKIKESLYEF